MQVIKRKIALNKIITYFLLMAICLGSLLAVMPLIGRNVDQPNLIVYFNHDEGFLMDLIWYYYSGEKRNSFQYENDYGIELLYLSDLSHIFLSKLIHITPGIFVLFIRWLHLFFWIAALLTLWRLVRHHFGGYWQALLVGILLAVSPAFPYLNQNSKPEPVVLFFTILGLDYLLRLTARASWMNLIIATACASLATLVKFTGIFLLPAIVMAMYFTSLDKKDQTRTFPILKIAWILPALIGIIFIILPTILIFFYVRQTSGLTWHKQFGVWNSFLRSIPMLCSLATGVLLIGFSFILRTLNQSKIFTFKRAISRIQLLLSYSTIVFLLFVLFSAFFGFKWIANPKYFIQTFATTGREAAINITSYSTVGFLLTFFKHFFNAIKEFDVLVFALFISYLFVEIRLISKNLRDNPLNFFKRVILAVFILQGIGLMCLPIRFTQHHMLPFFSASIILIVQAIRMVYLSAHETTWQKNAALGFFIVALFFNFLQNVKISVSSFRYMYHWRDDVVFDIARWWPKHYSSETSIVADHPVYLYLPDEYKNTVFLKFKKDKVEQLRNLVSTFRPQLIYYNTGTDGSNTTLPIEEILPNNEVRLVASFNNMNKYYKRYPYSRYLVYEIKY